MRKANESLQKGGNLVRRDSSLNVGRRAIRADGSRDLSWVHSSSEQTEDEGSRGVESEVSHNGESGINVLPLEKRPWIVGLRELQAYLAVGSIITLRRQFLDKGLKEKEIKIGGVCYYNKEDVDNWMFAQR